MIDLLSHVRVVIVIIKIFKIAIIHARLASVQIEMVALVVKP